MEVVLDIKESNPLLLETLERNPSFYTHRRSADIHLVAQHPEVYEPCDDSFALVDALLADRAHLVGLQPSCCLEVGCGSGYVITSLALMLADNDIKYIATDVNEVAVKTTEITLAAHHINAHVIVTDLVAGLEKQLAGAVDVLLFNPPYVPTPDEEVGVDGITSSWAGGYRGRAVIDRMLEIVDYILSNKGCFYLVTVTANNPGEICQLMRQKGFESRIAVQRYTEEESLHVLKFWREAPSDYDSSKSTPPSTVPSFLQGSLSHCLSRFMPFKQSS